MAKRNLLLFLVITFTVCTVAVFTFSGKEREKVPVLAQQIPSPPETFFEGVVVDDYVCRLADV